MSIKIATTDHAVHEFIAARWSPYAFDSRPVDVDDLRSLFEAARWAPSAFNEQPWRYIVATRQDPTQHEALLSCLVEANRAWAQAAPVVGLGISSLRFSRNDKPNATALHDLGLASAHLCFEATARGLSVHQMSGILPDRAREIYSIPEGAEAITALAIGYALAPDQAPEEFRERDTTPRTRNPLNDFVYGTTWGQTASALDLEYR
jgi:nitroreductase